MVKVVWFRAKGYGFRVSSLGLGGLEFRVLG